MKLRRIFTFILTTLTVFATVAADIKTVSGKAVYYLNDSDNIKSAKEKAVEQARLDAIASVFGTSVIQTFDQNEILDGDSERTHVDIFSSTEVNGEWIADDGEPEIETNVDACGKMFIVAKVKGKARKMSNNSVGFAAAALRNGTTDQFRDSEFRDGDRMYLRFRSPSDGYVAVYLVDDNQDVYCLFPYMSNSAGQFKVNHDTDYVLFDENHRYGGDGSDVDQYKLTCDAGKIEINRLYVIFSPQPFTKALDKQVDDGLPRQLSYRDFNKWLTTCRKRDDRMSVSVIKLRLSN